MARFTFRVVACVLWWVAAVLATAAYDEHNGVIAAVAWAVVIVLVAAGAAMWRGSES